MIRIAILLLVFSGGMHTGSSYATTPEIETLNESQSAFDLGGSRISVEIRDRVLRGKGDRGLDKTPTWGRTYWGGALFCLLADIEIRKLTGNRKSLRDALRGILEDGYSMQASATPMRIFESADRAVGVTVLVPLYQKMKADPFPVDLDKLWQELGVGFKNDAIVYDDDAPLAHIRKAMLRS
jgi:hypothetical protein